MTNKSGTLYVGLTNNLERIIFEHKNSIIEGFTRKYNINRLVSYEEINAILAAIDREKQIKGGWVTRELPLLNQSIQSGRN
jgi:putative endonuclease